MIQYFLCSVLLLLTFACGKSEDNSPQDIAAAAQSQNSIGVGRATDSNLQDASGLAGTYQQAENGQARIQINAENLVVGTTLVIPAPAGDGTRLTPRFPQVLVYNSAKDVFTTIGTYNDGQGSFKNVELRLRLYQQGRYLDVTLIIPPDEALSTRPNFEFQADADEVFQSRKNPHPRPKPTPSPKPCPPPTCSDCPVPQLIYVYRFVRV